MRRLLVTFCVFALGCTDATPVEQPAPATTQRPATTVGVETTTSTTQAIVDQLPPLCTDLYPDLDVSGDLAADRFVAEAQVRRAFRGWATSEQFVRQLLGSLEGVAAFRGPYTDEESATIYVPEDEIIKPRRVPPDEIFPVLEWLRLHDHVLALYHPSPSTMTVTYPDDAGPEFAALMNQAKQALAARPPSGDQFEVVWREVDYSSTELWAAADRFKLAVHAEWLDDPYRPDIRANRFAIDLGIADPDDAARIPEEFLPYLCLRTPLTEVGFGPQPATGDGWRILAFSDDPLALDPSLFQAITENPINVGSSLFLLDHRTALEELWRSLVIPDPVPDVDFDRERVVIWETLVYALCANWIRFEGHTLDPTTNKMNARATDFVYPYGCPASAAARRYVVAVESGGLPPDITPGQLVVTAVEPTD